MVEKRADWTDEQYVRRQMARKARRIASEFEGIAEQIRQRADQLAADSTPDVFAIVDDLTKAVTQASASAGQELRPIIGELATLADLRVEAAQAKED